MVKIKQENHSKTTEKIKLLTGFTNFQAALYLLVKVHTISHKSWLGVAVSLSP